MSKESELKELLQQLADLKKNKPYLFDLDDIAREMGNGTIDVTLRVYGGEVTDMLTHQHTRKKYPKQGDK